MADSAADNPQAVVEIDMATLRMIDEIVALTGLTPDKVIEEAIREYALNLYELRREVEGGAFDAD